MSFSIGIGQGVSTVCKRTFSIRRYLLVAFSLSSGLSNLWYVLLSWELSKIGNYLGLAWWLIDTENGFWEARTNRQYSEMGTDTDKADSSRVAKWRVTKPSIKANPALTGWHHHQYWVIDTYLALIALTLGIDCIDCCITSWTLYFISRTWIYTCNWVPASSESTPGNHRGTPWKGIVMNRSKLEGRGIGSSSSAKASLRSRGLGSSVSV